MELLEVWLFSLFMIPFRSLWNYTCRYPLMRGGPLCREELYPIIIIGGQLPY